MSRLSSQCVLWSEAEVSECYRDTNLLFGNTVDQFHVSERLLCSSPPAGRRRRRLLAAHRPEGEVGAGGV